MNKKSRNDVKKLNEFIDSLSREPWIGKSRNWWPRFLFHFTNINNAVNILESGTLFSRHYLEQNKLMNTDNASVDVMEQTEEKWKKYVRLYFRPRTPTQHTNEGFRPQNQRALNSHCPVPVYFIFDSKKILSRNKTLFSKGSLASSGTSVYSTIDEFKEIPFNLVYHDEWFYPEERSSIVYHRHAEVIYPEKLDLDDLKYIWCRSEAEYHTLLFLLSNKAKAKWKDKIGTGKKGNFFFRKWLFINEVDMNNEDITFKINQPESICDPFPAKLVIKEVYTGRKYFWKKPNFQLNPKDPTLKVSLSALKYSDYEAYLYFDKQIIYANKFVDNELPF